jgi:nucleotide-binding universal stress UspA family protein
VERINLDYPVSEEIHSHWERILETDTPQAQNLNRAIAELHRAGLEVNFKVRHGDPVGEIQAEIRDGDYDLVAMGSSYSGQSLRRMYLPSVTAEVAESMQRPVLTVRQGFFQLAES